MTSSAGFRLPEYNEEELFSSVADAMRNFSTPREFDKALMFLKSVLQQMPALLYGAGTHSARVLAELPKSLKGRIVGIVDRNAMAMGDFCGYRVFRPQDAAILDAAVIMAHPVWENDMVADAVSMGIHPDRLLRVYSNPTAALHAVRRLMKKHQEILSRSFRWVIVGSQRWTTVDEVHLAAIFPPTQTLILHFDPMEHSRPDSLFPTIDCSGSTRFLVAALRRLAPEGIYLRTMIATNYLGVVLRRLFPKAVLVHEVYDFAFLLGGAVLDQLAGLSPMFIEMTRKAEAYSLRHSDLVISKRQGECWNKMVEQEKLSYVCFFGGLVGAVSENPLPSPPISLLYAGILPKPRMLTNFRSDYNFLDMLEDLSGKFGFRIGIYNFLHNSEQFDPDFFEYWERFSGSNIQYNRCVNYQTLMSKAANFHFGWLYRNEVADNYPDMDVVVGNRFTGYINAGLPVIVDERQSTVSALVREFSAGVSLPLGLDSGMGEKILSIDSLAAREGVRKLKKSMIEKNNEIVSRISRLSE